MTAAPAPGISGPRCGSRTANTTPIGESDGAPRGPSKKRASRAIPARKRETNQVGSPCTCDLYRFRRLDVVAPRARREIPVPPHLGAANAKRQRPTRHWQDCQFVDAAQEARDKKGPARRPPPRSSSNPCSFWPTRSAPARGVPRPRSRRAAAKSVSPDGEQAVFFVASDSAARWRRATTDRQSLAALRQADPASAALEGRGPDGARLRGVYARFTKLRDSPRQRR